MIKELKLVKLASFILLLVAGAFVAFGPYYLGAILVMLVSFFVQWKFYRCPHCQRSLDMRMELNEEIHCPYCGKVISEGTK